MIAGTIVAGPHVRNACRRHLDDLRLAPARGFTWNTCTQAEIDKAREKGKAPEPPVQRIQAYFREVLCLAGGQFEGQPFELAPSQIFIAGSIHGWRRLDGTRRFRRAYIEEGKGNGKSPLAAGLGMYGLTSDDEQRAEVYAGASKKDQAMVLFRDAVAMYEQSPDLYRRLTPSGGNPVWNLTDPRTHSFFRPISSDDSQSGPRPHVALCDEIHEHRDGNMVEMLERGFKFRRQPLLFMITNSGTDRNSVCWNEHEHAVRVAAGTMLPDPEKFTYVGEPIDDEEFAYVCALDPGDDPLKDEACWIKVNPLLGQTVTYDYLRSVVKQAKKIPGKQNGVLRLHFCVWTDSDSAWMGKDTLEAVMADFNPEEHAGKTLTSSSDLSASQDLTANAYVVETGTKTVQRKEGPVELPCYDAWIEAWTPADTLEARSARDRVPYEEWVKLGYLNAIPGKVIRLDFVAARLAEVQSVYGIKAHAYDRYAYSKLGEELDLLGLDFPQLEHPQAGVRRAKPHPDLVEEAKRNGKPAPLGLWMPGSVKALEELILEERIRLLRNPVLFAACMGAVVETDPFDNKWFSKRKATTRIDPLVALAMAVGCATGSEPPAKKASVYEKRGFMVLGGAST